MTLRSLKTIGSLALATAMTLLLIGCRGAAGQDGLDGQSGNVINAKALTRDQWSNLRLKGEVTGVTVGANTVVKFKLSDEFGNPVSGMAFATKTGTALFPRYQNFAFGLAKLVPETPSGSAMVAPSRWVNYIVTNPGGTATSVTWSPTRPTTDNIGTLRDNGDGTYEYTFRREISKIQDQLNAYNYTGNNKREDLDDVTYQPALTHRLVIQISGTQPGTYTNTADESDSGIARVNLKPVNIVYDFVPSANRPVNSSDTQRELVSTEACNECHSTLTPHGGNRPDARYCAMCHTDQRKYGYADNSDRKQKNHAVGDFIMLGHTLHLGARGFPAMSNFNSRSVDALSPRTTHNYNYQGVRYKETGYPMDIRNCTKCHNDPAREKGGTVALQKDNWKKKPSRLACGACHDGIDWTVSHHGGVRTDDSSCGTCHGETGSVPPATVHRAADVAQNNPTTGVHANGSSGSLPANLVKYRNFTYDLKSATLNASRNPIVTFRIMLDGVPITDQAQLRTPPTGFSGGPSFYMAHARPQDGINNPADFTGQVSAALSATANTFSGPDADGYWTATLSGITLPADATMVMCYMARGYTQTDVNTASGNDSLYYRYRVTPSKKVTVSGYSARREITDPAKCNDCHAMLGTSYITRQYGAHGAGVANDASLCGVCHIQTGTSNGWPRNIQFITHAVHAVGKRSVQYNRYINVSRPNLPNGIGAYGYPGVLNNCEQCHYPGTYDFSASAYTDDLKSRMLWSTVAAGTIAGGNTTSTYVTPGVNYGTAGSNGTPAGTATLVNSPITNACFGCHTTENAVNHMELNGGTIYKSRGSVNGEVLGAKLNNKESCLVCHGSGKMAEIKYAHMKKR